MSLQVPVKLFRGRPGSPAHFETYTVGVPDDATVIDVIQAVWAQHDRTLLFRHACHHASCGTCAVRLNGYECLPCIVPVTEALSQRAELVIEPLRNFPLIGDLVVDMAGFFEKQAGAGAPFTRRVEPVLDGQSYQSTPIFDDKGAQIERPYSRFESCIECGICLSACPTMAAGDKFMGPAALAGVQRALLAASEAGRTNWLLALADSEQGVWRCHSAFECVEACPQQSDPAGAIMALRRKLVGRKFKTLFGRDT